MIIYCVLLYALQLFIKTMIKYWDRNIWKAKQSKQIWEVGFVGWCTNIEAMLLSPFCFTHPHPSLCLLAERQMYAILLMVVMMMSMYKNSNITNYLKPDLDYVRSFQDVCHYTTVIVTICSIGTKELQYNMMLIVHLHFMST